MTVRVTGLGWLGTRTEHFDQLCGFYANVFGLPKIYEEPGFAVFRLPSGENVEVFAPDYAGQEHFTTGPVVGFGVEDIDAARAEMEAAGIEFLIPTDGAPDGGRWAHFRGPDGNVYEITQRPQ